LSNVYASARDFRGKRFLQRRDQFARVALVLKLDDDLGVFFFS